MVPIILLMNIGPYKVKLYSWPKRMVMTLLLNNVDKWKKIGSGVRNNARKTRKVDTLDMDMI